MTLWNTTELNGDCAGWPYHVLKVFDDKMIVYERIWLKFPQPIKHLLFYFPYKNSIHSFISNTIYFIAPVYELLITSRILSWLYFFSRKFSPLVIGVVPKKNNDSTVCWYDMRRANKAVIRKLFPIPTVDEFLQDLNQPKIYIKWAYYQLSSNSGEITISGPL